MESHVLSCATYSICQCIHACVTTPGQKQQTRRPALLPLLENLLPTSSPSLTQPITLPGHQSGGLHFYRTLLSDSVQQALRSNHCYGSDMHLSCRQSASQKFTPGYTDFGNATKEQPVASCHRATINTIKNLLCSYSQMPRDNLLLIKYS